jgi:4-aminobutyrate aminotransferase-like enzyme
VEPIVGCGGQVPLPKPYLKELFQHIKINGCLAIADEVQTGFGRVGTHFWAFEQQDAVPDILVLGKPIGNGHPLAAVITTPEIAGSFENGMEFFSSFGGNPVSCAIGNAVLEVIKEEELQSNALAMGSKMLQLLKELQSRYPMIGDVRGSGLFLGIELIRNENLDPATDGAKILINNMKDLGVLLSTDGPFNNVIKIKPPLCIDESDIDFFLNNLDKELQSLSEEFK